MIVRRPYFLYVFLMLAGLAKSTCAQANETVLYSFQGGSDGYSPVGSIVFDKAGSLYGATPYTSPCVTSFQCGSVYELSPPQQPGAAWTFTTLYTFKGRNSGDGGAPTGGLVQDAYGNLYGLTGYGGTGPCVLLGTSVGCGTVYELIRPTEPGADWQEKILYSFQGNQDGQLPEGDLVFDKLGNLYGATWFGGGKGDSNTCNSLYPYCGTIFELSPPRSASKSSAWTEKVLYSFQGFDAADGGEPNGGLLLGQGGVLYGTTNVGGSGVTFCEWGCGIVYSLSPVANDGEWTESILHNFLNYPDDGAAPNGNMISVADGVVGTTRGGGEHEDGVIFELLPSGGSEKWAESFLHICSGGSGGHSPSAVVVGPDGKIYGASEGGGDRTNDGLMFRLTRTEDQGDIWSFITFYQFAGSPDGRNPISLRFGKDNAIYGTTAAGGNGPCPGGGCGTVYMIGP